MSDSAKRRLPVAGLAVIAGTLVAAQLIVPALFDMVFTIASFGLGWAAGKLSQ